MSVGELADIAAHAGMGVSDGNPPSGAVTDSERGWSRRMALNDDDRRRLAEIERRLTEDDPSLARRLARFGRARSVRTIVTFVAVCVCFVAGLILVAGGVRLRFWPVSVVGVVLAVVVPPLLVWRVWSREER